MINVYLGNKYQTIFMIYKINKLMQHMAVALVVVSFVFISLLSSRAFAVESADAHCINITPTSAKTKCATYVKAYNSCESISAPELRAQLLACQDKAYTDYLNSVCGSTDSKDRRDCISATNKSIITNLNTSGGIVCASLGKVENGCKCPTGEVARTVGTMNTVMCVSESSTISENTSTTTASTTCTGGGLSIPNCNGDSYYQCAPGTPLADCVKSNPIMAWLTFFINVISAVIGVGAIIMVIFAGIQYSAARDNPQAIQAAKQKLINVLIGLAAFVFMYAFLQWLIPGGVF